MYKLEMVFDFIIALIWNNLYMFYFRKPDEEKLFKGNGKHFYTLL